MFWSFRNPLRIPGLVTNTVRRWSSEADYTLLPNYSDSGRSRTDSEWSVASAGELGDKDREKDESGRRERESGGGREWTRAVIPFLVICAGGIGLWRCVLPSLSARSADGGQIPEQVVDVVRETLYNDSDSTHVYLAPQYPLPSTRPLLKPSEPTVAHRDLLEYISTGAFPPIDMESGDIEVQVDQVDLVYLWVNSTDPFFPEAFEFRMEEEGLPVERGQARRWRDNGELKGSVRSSVQSLGDSLRKVHIVSGDYPLDDFQKDNHDETSQSTDTDQNQVVKLIERKLTFNENTTGSEEGWSVGQIPEWLDWTSEDDTITWHFHSDIYRLPKDHSGELLVGREVMAGMVLLGDDGEVVNGTNESLEQEWRELALPTFNSFAIESRVGWVKGLHEKFVMSNDDMFFLNSLSASDFHHPILGPVLRMAPSLPVYPYLTPDLLTTHGEWGGLQHASTLLSRRFTNRPQAYPEHFPKSLTLGMMDEASIMFAEELSIAATRGFRESNRGLADLEMAALTSWLRIERWREALIWTWVVAKIGGVEGVWGDDAREALRELFGTALEEGKTAIVHKGPRTTVRDADRYLFVHNMDEPLSTRIRFSSLDGHLPKNPDKPLRQCQFMPYCLPDNYFTDTSSTYSAAEVFKRIAFERPQCGDCLIDALITASGERGLSAFLPSPETTYSPTSSDEQWDNIGPILPLTKQWRTTNFPLDKVITGHEQPINLREWCTTLLGRYVYTIGATPAVFAPVASIRQLSFRLGEVDKHPETALVCINDDISDKNELGATRFKEMLENWMDRRWPKAGLWERSGG